MRFPNVESATHPAQAVADATDFTILTLADDGIGVVSGFTATPKSPTAMMVEVASGTFATEAGVWYDVADTTEITIPAASTGDVRNLIVAGLKDGVPSVWLVLGRPSALSNWSFGTLSAPPIKPTIPVDAVAIAEVYVVGVNATATTTITATEIVDKRVIVSTHQGPQGSQGPQGYQGFWGYQGRKGNQGHTGATGVSGSQGHQGHQGHKGTKGRQGSQGVLGLTGPQGHQGALGRQGSSSTAHGPTGASGAQGATGARGTQGRAGFAGIPSSTTGSQGNQGNQGRQGFQGFQGATGIGTPGTTGVDGPQGSRGFTNLAGASGANGSDGAQGVQGVTDVNNYAPFMPTGYVGETFPRIYASTGATCGIGIGAAGSIWTSVYLQAGTVIANIATAVSSMSSVGNYAFLLADPSFTVVAGTTMAPYTSGTGASVVSGALKSGAGGTIASYTIPTDGFYYVTMITSSGNVQLTSTRIRPSTPFIGPNGGIGSPLLVTGFTGTTGGSGATITGGSTIGTYRIGGALVGSVTDFDITPLYFLLS